MKEIAAPAAPSAHMAAAPSPFETFDVELAIRTAEAHANDRQHPRQQFVYCKPVGLSLLFFVSSERLPEARYGPYSLLAQVEVGQPRVTFEDRMLIRAAAIRGASRDRWLAQQTRRELYFVLRCLVGIALVVAAVVFIAWRSS